MRPAVRIVLLSIAALSVLAGAGHATQGKFYIVGMGTTNDLVTVRGINVIKSADIFLLESQSDAELWKEFIGQKEVWFCPNASRVFYGVDAKTITDPTARAVAGKLEAIRRQTTDKIAAAVRAGKNVASLQGGDPMMYGMTWYLDLLPKDIPREIVPGVGAFNAASAAVEMSPPYAWDTDSVILTIPDWPGQAATNEQLMEAKSSMFFYTMGLVRYPELFEQLKRHYPLDTPVAVVSFAGDREKQQVIRSTVGRFLQEVDYQKLPNNMHMLLVGKFLTIGQARKEGVASGRDMTRLLRELSEYDTK